MKAYFVNEIFYSIQGEGVRAGMPALFLRFAGCNLRCTKAAQGFDCDTDHAKGFKLTVQEILAELAKAGDGRGCDYVILTGGEPALQLDDELVHELQDAGYYLGIETNGTKALRWPLAWVTISPKRGTEIHQRIADEVKIVLGPGQVPPVELITRIRSDNWLVSPAFNGPNVDPEALKWCVQFCLERPEFRLSVQQHKLWGVR